MTDINIPTGLQTCHADQGESLKNIPIFRNLHKKNKFVKTNFMAGSAIDNELIHYFKQLDDQQKKSILEMIKSFLNPPSKQPGEITIEAYNNELQEAEAEYERGEYVPHEEMLKQISKWEDNTK